MISAFKILIYIPQQGEHTKIYLSEMLPLAASPVQSIQFIIAIVEGAISTNEEKKHSSFLEMGISVGRISFFNHMSGAFSFCW